MIHPACNGGRRDEWWNLVPETLPPVLRHPYCIWPHLICSYLSLRRPTQPHREERWRHWGLSNKSRDLNERHVTQEPWRQKEVEQTTFFLTKKSRSYEENEPQFLLLRTPPCRPEVRRHLGSYACAVSVPSRLTNGGHQNPLPPHQPPDGRECWRGQRRSKVY